MRHTGITFMISNGVDLITVKEIAGHADIKTTMEYSHLLVKEVMNVAETIQPVPIIKKAFHGLGADDDSNIEKEPNLRVMN